MLGRFREALRLRELEQKGDENARFQMLVTIAQRLMPGYPLRWPQLDWMGDAWFNHYLKRVDAHFAAMNAERRWLIYQLLRLVHEVPGDTAECGVFEGAMSYLICDANRNSPLPRQHHLFDSFEGLPEPGQLDGPYWSRGDFAGGTVERVRETLAEYEELSFHKGWIPERFPEVADRRFAFVHVDVDLYQPTRDSLEFFYPRVTPGGILVVDDYWSSVCPGATRAVDEFLADKPEKMLILTGGGGFIIKGRATAPQPR